MELTKKDIEKLKAILISIQKGTASTFDKKANIEALEGILEPKCAVCRKPIEDEVLVLNDRKMHPKCQGKYKC